MNRVNLQRSHVDRGGILSRSGIFNRRVLHPLARLDLDQNLTFSGPTTTATLRRFPRRARTASRRGSYSFRLLDGVSTGHNHQL